MHALKITRFLKTSVRAALMTALVVTPLLAIQKVNAGTDTFIGEAPTMSNGAGLVLVVGLSRS